MLRAQALLKGEGGRRAAEEELKAALEEDRGNIEAHFALGHIYKSGGANALAAAAFRRVLALKPRHSGALSALDGLGDARRRAQGRLEDQRAAQALRGFLRRAPPAAHRANGGSMSVKSDKWIRRMSLEKGMIEPFSDKQVREGVISYGVSSYGYDVRIADEFKIFTNINSTIVDPKKFDPRSFVDFKGDVCIIPPNSFALARTVEYFRIPRNVITVCVGKSTYARCGIIVNVTPFEPEWEGIVTLEVSNTTPLPARIYANEGIAQVLFFESDEQCETSYADKKGKYQAQQGLTLPKL